MLIAHAWAWRLWVHLHNNIKGLKGLDLDPLWELGLAHGPCGNKVIDTLLVSHVPALERLG